MTPVPDNRRFYHGKSPHPFRNLCLSLLIFVVICGLFSVGITRISNRTRQEQKNSLEHALWRGGYPILCAGRALPGDTAGLKGYLRHPL